MIIDIKTTELFSASAQMQLKVFEWVQRMMKISHLFNKINDFVYWCCYNNNDVTAA